MSPSTRIHEELHVMCNQNNNYQSLLLLSLDLVSGLSLTQQVAASVAAVGIFRAGNQ